MCVRAIQMNFTTQHLRIRLSYKYTVLPLVFISHTVCQGNEPVHCRRVASFEFINQMTWQQIDNNYRWQENNHVCWLNPWTTANVGIETNSEIFIRFTWVIFSTYSHTESLRLQICPPPMATGMHGQHVVLR